VSDNPHKEGVALQEEVVHKFPGLRSLSKLSLNSFWGKFGQRLHMRQHTYFHEEDAFFATLSNPAKQVEVNTIQLLWMHNAAFVPDDMKTNIFVAVFTTSWARLKLHGVLDSLRERVLYFDTDEYDPPLRDNLGDHTDELEQGQQWPKNLRLCHAQRQTSVQGTRI
jgi:hypothetical protein